MPATFDDIPKGLADPPKADLFEAIKADLQTALAHYKSLATAGITLSGLWELTTSLTASLVQIADMADEKFAGQDKKAVVLAVAAQFYDDVIAPLDIPYVPNFIETRFVDPKLRVVFLDLVGGAIESFVKVFNGVPHAMSATTGKPNLPLY